MLGPSREVRGSLPPSRVAGTCITLLISTLTLTLSPSSARGRDDQASLYKLLKDAQTTNRAALERGRMVAHVTLLPGKDRPTIESEATVLWERGRGLWIYRLSDPEKVYSPNNLPTEWGAPLAKQRTAYRMIDKNKGYYYEPYKEMLFIQKFDPTRGDMDSPILDVTPPLHWLRCCPPTHHDGRPWTELIGPDSPATSAGATVSIERGSDGLIRQTRVDPGLGKLEIVFSPDFCHNVVEVTYLGQAAGIRSQHGGYQWEKLPNGICVLKSCRFEQSAPGAPKDIDQIYNLEIKSIDLKANVSSRISFNALKAYLPPNVEVVDKVNNRSYQLNPVPAMAEAARFRRNSAEIRSRGFLKTNR